ncbi:MAG: hypothetical protein AAFR35_10090 [Pseudomonadota bacterium]
MKEALALLFMIVAVLLLSNGLQGYDRTYDIAYGALTVMAAMISGTFLWLWSTRATPLALGMACSWAGAASVMGWWWTYSVAGAPAAMKDAALLFVFLALYFVGAILHFLVIQRSMGLGSRAFLWPVCAALVIATAVSML